MKLLLLAALLLPAILTAQVPPQSAPGRLPPIAPGRLMGYPAVAETFPDNYQMTLSLTNKDGPPLEVSVVVATPQFSASLSEEGLSFSGTVKVEESGSIVISYSLGWMATVPTGNNTTQYLQSSTQGSVRLKLGEEVQIIRAGTRTARLAITKLESSKAKAK